MRKFLIAFLACVGVLSASSVSQAVLIFGIDDSSGQTLVAFDSASPGSYQNGAAISGLQSGETIKGIDFRPSTNQLYALGSTSRLYTLNPITGAATQVGGPGPFSPVLSGSNFGFDFNPEVDMIRVVSNTKKNYVLNPNTGTAVAATDLAFGPGPNFGVPANVEFSAYTNSVSPAPATTQLYGIDTGLDILVTQTNSAGVLTEVGPLGVNVGAVGGFDINGAGNIAYAALLPSSTSASNLYSINLATGAATSLGQIDGGAVVSALTVAPDGFNPFIPEPASVALLAFAAVGMIGRKFRAA
jgi:hypothetical protein